MPVSIGLNARYEFHDTALSRSVEQARHAVAIDERRAPFAPTLWSNIDRFNTPGARPRVAQQWFPGDHGGFLPEPVAFAQVLTSVLTQAPAPV